MTIKLIASIKLIQNGVISHAFGPVENDTRLFFNGEIEFKGLVQLILLQRVEVEE